MESKICVVQAEQKVVYVSCPQGEEKKKIKEYARENKLLAGTPMSVDPGAGITHIVFLRVQSGTTSPDPRAAPQAAVGGRTRLRAEMFSSFSEVAIEKVVKRMFPANYSLVLNFIQKLKLSDNAQWAGRDITSAGAPSTVMPQPASPPDAAASASASSEGASAEETRVFEEFLKKSGLSEDFFWTTLPLLISQYEQREMAQDIKLIMEHFEIVRKKGQSTDVEMK